MRKHFTNIQNNAAYKYRIKEKLEKFSYPDYMQSKRCLPKSLGINPRTFERYLYAKHTDKYEMPVGQLAALAMFFDCPMEELLNYEPRKISLRGISKREKKDLALNLGLIK